MMDEQDNREEENAEPADNTGSVQNDIQADEYYRKLKRSSFRVTAIAALLFIAGMYIILNDLGYFEMLKHGGLIGEVLLIIFLSIILYFVFYYSAGKQQSEEAKEKFTRSVNDVIFAGVCGGLGEYLNVNANIIRFVWTALSIFTLGIPAVIYLYFYLTLPRGGDE